MVKTAWNINFNGFSFMTSRDDVTGQKYFRVFNLWNHSFPLMYHTTMFGQVYIFTLFLMTSLWRHQKKGQNEISTQHGRMIHQWKAMISEISNMKLFLTYDVIAWRHKGKTVKNGHFRPFLPLNSVIWCMLSHHIVMKY